MKKKLLSLLLAGAMIFALAACGNDTADATPTPGGTNTETPGTETPDDQNPSAEGEIVIGILQDITGATSSLGQMVEAGANWAVDEINANGGVNGQTIRTITYDTQGDVTEAVNAFTRAVTVDNVSAIIGPPVANIALAIAPISEEYDVPVLGFAMDLACTIKDDGTPYKNMFLFQPNADQQSAIMASYAIKNGFETFGIIYNQSNAYSTSLLPNFRATVEAGGGTIAQEVSYGANDKDFATLLAPIINAGVDAIYVPNYTQELVQITDAARNAGFEGALICGLDACPPFNTIYGADCDGIYFINNVDDTEADLQAMIAEVKEATGIDATNKFFLGYDVANILADIIAEVGTDPAAIAEATANVTNYEGLTGNITIDPDTHMPTGLEMVMFTYEGSTPVMLERYTVQD
ncbi:MAG TPA: ABC transporter substrate-binding protein [Candidatus Galloscillospira excrementavium]|nr:ABC transporter substrate-binding protein [Candidatus Galloscillospira excrementavium]